MKRIPEATNEGGAAVRETRIACFEVAGLVLRLEGRFAQVDELFELYAPYRRASIESPHLVHVTLGAATPEPGDVLTLRRGSGWATLSGDGRVRIGGTDGFHSINRLLMHAFAGVLAGRGGLIMHAAAVEGPRGTIAFLGPSEAGKTTAARNCPARMLHQDRVAMGVGCGGPWLAPVPFLYGEPRGGPTGRQPLDQIVFIEKAAANSVSPMAPREAMTRIMATAIVPAVPEIAGQILATVEAVAAATTVRTLRARRDGGFWPLLVGPVAPRSEFD